MNNEPTPSGGKPVYDGAEGDTWNKSLMRRTEELSHVQAQAGAVQTRAPAPSEPRGGPGPGTPLPRAGAAQRGAQVARALPQRPPPAPVRPLASALRLGSAAFALMAAALLVFPEFQQRLSRDSGDVTPESAPQEQTLAPRFDAAAPVRVGEVREQHAPIQGASLLMAESEPSGVTVSVDGVKQGTTPLSVTLICTPGASMHVKFVRKGYDTVEHVTVCRADTMTELSTRLRKARSGAKP
ncbi:PEGA domain-containing protein [Pyxidicoccus fallax]|uniref:PEGA domain-containing protein n=1 Tax=Pyxidicoccus fallax TaxID=394095 RepID=A0A848M070_9BACT|nr:PEGA domain-containing protein [Pyxidicoccus fallax]NMO22953.1 PEGA domain-containing protein [Pyxidicoccus fallax]NPC85416.1 PEGA domain-containing protein [Pyxidicoccus fallax]